MTSVWSCWYAADKVASIFGGLARGVPGVLTQQVPLATPGGAGISTAEVSAPKTVVRKFEPKAGSVPAARHFVEAQVGPDRAHPALPLLVSELVTNAVVHARTAFTVSVTVAADLARVEVMDEAGGVPQVMSHTPGRESGRGLALVEAIALRWGYQAAAGGKTVWFEVALAPY